MSAHVHQLKGPASRRVPVPPNWPFHEGVIGLVVNDLHTQRRLLILQLKANPNHDLIGLVL